MSQADLCFGFYRHNDMLQLAGRQNERLPPGARLQPAAASAQAQLLHEAALDGQAPAEGGGARPHRQPRVLPRLQAPAACRGRAHMPQSVTQVDASAEL